jgi:hypothetical protein
MSMTSQKHRAALERFAALLAGEAYQTHLLAASDAVPYDVLLVRIETFEQENRVWSLEMSFLPGLENDLDGVSILQNFVALSDRISEEHRPSLNQLILKINAKLPIGGFDLLDDPRILFFKHNALLPNDNDEASFRVVRELVSMTNYLITTFSEPLIQVAAGQKTVEEALADNPFSNVIG